MQLQKVLAYCNVELPLAKSSVGFSARYYECLTVPHSSRGSIHTSSMPRDEPFLSRWNLGGSGLSISAVTCVVCWLQSSSEYCNVIGCVPRGVVAGFSELHSDRRGNKRKVVIEASGKCMSNVVAYDGGWALLVLLLMKLQTIVC